ncbi:hypothetical protein D3C76_827270 [compost metagenome]
MAVPTKALSKLNVKSSLTASPPESVAVTVMPMSPGRVPAGGTPLKLRLGASKLSHAGKGSPFARRALRTRLSSASTSAKTFAGKV